MQTITIITDRSEAADRPCQEWHNGHSGGSIPHQPYPTARISGRITTTEYECYRCDKYMHTELRKPVMNPPYCPNGILG